MLLFILRNFIHSYLRVTHHKNDDTTVATIQDVKMYLSEYNDEQVDGTDEENY